MSRVKLRSFRLIWCCRRAKISYAREFLLSLDIADSIVKSPLEAQPLIPWLKFMYKKLLCYCGFRGLPLNLFVPVSLTVWLTRHPAFCLHLYVLQVCNVSIEESFICLLAKLLVINVYY